MKRPDSISWIWRPSRNNFAQVPPKLREILSQLKRDVWIRSFAKSADSCHDNLLTLECSSRPCICHHSTIETSHWDWHQQGESLHQSAATDITGYQIPTESLMWLLKKNQLLFKSRKKSSFMWSTKPLSAISAWPRNWTIKLSSNKKNLSIYHNACTHDTHDQHRLQLSQALPWNVKH